MQPTVMKANQSTDHNITRCSAVKRYKSGSILNYNDLDKSTFFTNSWHSVSENLRSSGSLDWTGLTA